MNEAEIKARILEIERGMAAPDFWANKSAAQEKVKEFNELKEQLLGVGRYEKGNALLTILAGAGGDDAEDFAAMLARMYQKFAEKKGFGISVFHQNENDHGGFRNITFEINGKGAYGELKNESGVHRLVRISPFNANQKRHTSFAMVEVVPELPAADKEIDIPEADLKIEFSRSSGPGGQNVNKRETAVRVVHIPSGIAVHADSERSQERNREKALTLLRGKLYRKRQEDREKEAMGMRVSSTVSAEWGSQIRSYVLHPYKMVKDHRTGAETSDVDA
ncbi:MAG: PCRF domain-containing protein, partial [Candidatus Lloydbacteria bacterium]|nr:PCRF domain-containing protein [Candidatus Lloydbacteria bacterium]